MLFDVDAWRLLIPHLDAPSLARCRLTCRSLRRAIDAATPLFQKVTRLRLKHCRCSACSFFSYSDNVLRLRPSTIDTLCLHSFASFWKSCHVRPCDVNVSTISFWPNDQDVFDIAFLLLFRDIITTTHCKNIVFHLSADWYGLHFIKAFQYIVPTSIAMVDMQVTWFAHSVTIDILYEMIRLLAPQSHRYDAFKLSVEQIGGPSTVDFGPFHPLTEGRFQEVNLGNVHFLPALSSSIPEFTQIKGLKGIYMNCPSSHDMFLESLGDSQLQRVGLVDCSEFTLQTFELFANVLKRSDIRELNLTICPKAMEKFLRRLSDFDNSKLETVRLNLQIGQLNINEFRDELECGVSFNSLQLGLGQILESDMYILSAMLTRSPCLTYLDLSRNKISDNALLYFSGTLAKTNLETLNLTDNIFTQSGLMYLADALPQTRIKKLETSVPLTIAVLEAFLIFTKKSELTHVSFGQCSDLHTISLSTLAQTRIKHMSFRMKCEPSLKSFRTRCRKYGINIATSFY